MCWPGQTRVSPFAVCVSSCGTLFFSMPPFSDKTFAWLIVRPLDNYSQLLIAGLVRQLGVPRRCASRRLVQAAMATKNDGFIVKSRKGSGTAIMWFRNDLRVADNEALLRAWQSSSNLLPLYVLDPRVFGSTHIFKFPKTGELRAQFILESVRDLRTRLQQRSLDLVIRLGKPEDVLPSIATAVGAHTIYAHKETTSEEIAVEKCLQKCLESLTVVNKEATSGDPQVFTQKCPKLELVWGGTLYHIDDLPFTPNQLPDVYTQFRKAVEHSSRIRPACILPSSLGPLPSTLEKVGGCGSMPTLVDVDLTFREQDPLGAMKFIGGETAALARLKDYFWDKDKVRTYKETRNGMLGADYSTKFSPWLAHGCITPRIIHEELKKYEEKRVANESTYWVLFELLWRDYFRFLSIKYGNAIFQLGGPRHVVGKKWSQDKLLFQAWRDGRTGYPLIDANMRELAKTGFMSNRGRQIVCSFLTRDMKLDWRLGGEWFESCLLDYDPCSNYGNWTYGAGVGNDPREDRYFSIPKQAQNYDPNGDYVAHWIPELSGLPGRARNNPGDVYLTPVVPLMHGQVGERSRQQFGGQNRSQKEDRRRPQSGERRRQPGEQRR